MAKRKEKKKARVLLVDQETEREVRNSEIERAMTEGCEIVIEVEEGVDLLNPEPPIYHVSVFSDELAQGIGSQLHWTRASPSVNGTTCFAPEDGLSTDQIVRKLRRITSPLHVDTELDLRD